MELITVFTPTYNRAYIIGKLYESLCRQTCRDFEWLVVDDGSTDGTEQLIAGFVAQGAISIRYVKQPNQGKHVAINTGVAQARGDLFFIVDSDDYLTPGAVQWMADEWRRVKGDSRFAGVSGIRVFPDGTKIGGGPDFGTIDADPLSIRYVHHVRGDLAEAWRTTVLAEHPFPVVPGEKFCTEGLVWGRIAQTHVLRYVHRGIYVCNYLGDGLTTNSVKCRRNSPECSMLAYSEFMRFPQVPFARKVACAINYWRFSGKGRKPMAYRVRQAGVLSLAMWLPGKAFAVLDSWRLKQQKH